MCLIPPDDPNIGDSFTERKKRRQEERTGVPITDAPWEPDEINYALDLLLDSNSRKEYREKFAVAFPHRSMDANSNNDPVWHYIANRKKIHPVKRPRKRARRRWTWGDKYVLEIVSRPRQVEAGKCCIYRVSDLLRRDLGQVREPLTMALRAAGTLEHARQLKLI